MLTTDAGRARFWAEEAVERDGHIRFRFPNGAHWRCQILEARPSRRFSVRYYNGTTATFRLEDDGSGGIELILVDAGVSPDDRRQVMAGWASVLLALKAAANFAVDLRNHDLKRAWAQEYVDNSEGPPRDRLSDLVWDRVVTDAWPFLEPSASLDLLKLEDAPGLPDGWT